MEPSDPVLVLMGHKLLQRGVGKPDSARLFLVTYQKLARLLEGKWRQEQ